MRGLLGGLSIAILGLGACKPAHPADAGGFATAFVDAARGEGLGADWVDDVMIARIRRAQRLQNAAKAKATPEQLARAWNDDPTPGLPYEQRSKLQRDRAAHGIKRSLHGRCDARDDHEGVAKRVEAVSASIEGAPADAKEELARLARDLSSAHLVRVNCDDGAVGLVLVPSGKSWQAVDVFPLGGLHMPVPQP
ncbi:MAG TPA: hypothetical protein VFF06_18010 [Polyangia bacterium]|nr:hypothetical protein [Polyangia bacterium]